VKVSARSRNGASRVREMKTPTKTILILGAGLALLAVGYLQGYLHGAVGALNHSLKGILKDSKKLRGQSLLLEPGFLDPLAEIAQFIGGMEVVVDQKPFGMHVKRGTLQVVEVFPGFPAEKAGIRAGCNIKKVKNQTVEQGTWLEAFQRAEPPFNMTLHCPPRPLKGQGPLNSDAHNHRVLVVSKPFGMNVQVNIVPRVIEVLPGYPAERAGVKRGFVLKAVNDVPVNATNWFDLWQKAEPPCTLTFDKSVPVHKDNPFFNEKDGTWLDTYKGLFNSSDEAVHPEHFGGEYMDEDVEEAEEDFTYYTVTVVKTPFGMHVSSAPGSPPKVVAVVAGMPAETAGVKAGDILLQVAGRPVGSATWFSAIQQAVPPFGLKLKRPINVTTEAEAVKEESIHKANLTVLVSERPFGMHVRRGSSVVGEVFPGFAAYKNGVRKGCEVREINHVQVSEGTWMEAFQAALLPFELKLLCPLNSTKHTGALAGKGALSNSTHRYRVMVHQRPYGMNVQVNVVPRVIDVLPGSAAEAAGVKVGFVIIEVNDKPVNGSNWFDEWEKAPKPSTLTFDTSMPLHKDNPYLEADEATEDGKIDFRNIPRGFGFPGFLGAQDTELTFGYTEVKVAVEKIPFGMQVGTPHRTRPIVQLVTPGLPAAKAGVKPGDVLVEVAGLPVTADTWFASFQQATPPFGLTFKRPLANLTKQLGLDKLGLYPGMNQSSK